jgi:hypothetical protein
MRRRRQRNGVSFSLSGLRRKRLEALQSVPGEK